MTTPISLPFAYGAFFVSRPRKVVETFWIHQNVRNGHVYIRLMKQHMLQNAYFLRYSRKTDFVDLAMPKMSYFTDARATFLHLVPLCNFLHTFFRACGTNLAQETIEKSWASCPNDHAHFLAFAFVTFFVFWPTEVVETFWIHQNVRNSHVYIQLMKQLML